MDILLYNMWMAPTFCRGHKLVKSTVAYKCQSSFAEPATQQFVVLLLTSLSQHNK